MRFHFLTRILKKILMLWILCYNTVKRKKCVKTGLGLSESTELNFVALYAACKRFEDHLHHLANFALRLATTEV